VSVREALRQAKRVSGAAERLRVALLWRMFRGYSSAPMSLPGEALEDMPWRSDDLMQAFTRYAGSALQQQQTAAAALGAGGTPVANPIVSVAVDLNAVPPRGHPAGYLRTVPKPPVLSLGDFEIFAQDFRLLPGLMSFDTLRDLYWRSCSQGASMLYPDFVEVRGAAEKG
jgi:hypothetical protein